MSSAVNTTPRSIGWTRWIDHPERVWLRQATFQVHFWIGTLMAVYVVLMSLSGSIIVFRNELPPTAFVEWLVRLHGHLAVGASADALVGIGAVALVVISITGAVVW